MKTRRKTKNHRRTKQRAQNARQMTLREAADEFGVSHETLRRRLAKEEIPVGAGVTYTVAQVHRVLAGELEHERIRSERARASLLEYERAEKERELVSLAEVQAMYSESLLPVRQRFLALPSEAAARCNPSDPEFARAALQRWVDDAFPIIREQLPKPMKVPRRR